MYQKTNEVKVLRDPIHGYIHIEYQVIWDCLNAKEFQRLRRIHQLGGDFQVYHTAEHSRFAHSLGVYEIARRMVSEVQSISRSLSEYEKIQVLCAALLHDLGHGPFSHFFESLQTKNHEQRTMEIILDEASEVHQMLVKEDPLLPSQVVKILAHEHQNEVLNQMISSQLDADRMDYLLRDAYETGTSYGTFDLERILRTMRVHHGRLCMKESGMHSVEDYIMARYHMYWQVYLHPDAKAYEVLIALFFKRFFDSNVSLPLLDCMRHELSNEEFFLLDEYRMMVGFQQALSCKDEILRSLARKILDRHLPKYEEDPKDEKALRDRYESKYGWYEQINQAKAYLPYQELSDKQTIYILDKNREIKPLSSCSQIVKALLKMETTAKKRFFYID